MPIQFAEHVKQVSSEVPYVRRGIKLLKARFAGVLDTILKGE